jgi:hypothetical protein
VKQTRPVRQALCPRRAIGSREPRDGVLLANIEYTEMTDERLRHPGFKGLTDPD